MTDKLKTQQHTDDRPEYEAPQAMHLTSLHVGRGQCMYPGSGPGAEYCYQPGNSASDSTCSQPGNSALACGSSGSSPTT